MKKLTIEDVKNCIGFDKTKGVGLTLSNMVDIWYKQKITEGEQVAVEYAMDELAKEILKFVE